ncbi:MAG: hypothetical protein AAF085_05340, partial [Planctomycetota bacterium]
MRCFQYLIVLFVCLLISGCSTEDAAVETPSSPPELTDRVAKLMGGWPHAKAITETGKATAFRIGKDEDFKEFMLSDGVELTTAQRQALVDLLAR